MSPMVVGVGENSGGLGKQDLVPGSGLEGKGSLATGGREERLMVNAMHHLD